MKIPLLIENIHFLSLTKVHFRNHLKEQRHYRFKHLSRQWFWLYSESRSRQTTITQLENRKLSAQKVEYGSRKC